MGGKNRISRLAIELIRLIGDFECVKFSTHTHTCILQIGFLVIIGFPNEIKYGRTILKSELKQFSI